MDFCSQPGLLPIETAIAHMQAAIQPVNSTEVVELQAALDRVLAEAIHSAVNIPSHDNSAMDGYALCTKDLEQSRSLRVLGSALAGHPFVGDIGNGECIRIMTGAIVPAQTDAVIMQEQVSAEGENIVLDRIPTAGENIRLAGEDISQGDLVLAQGKRITPVDIGLLASLGVTHLRVFQRLRVGVFSTGDELKALGQPLEAGELYDSNRQTLIALLTRLNVDIIDLGLIADDPQGISAAFQSAAAQTDAVISSGGVSVGAADYTRDVLQKIGSIDFWKIAIKPGKPFAFGSLTNNSDGSCWFFGLPGNPVSTLVTYHQLVLPALRYLAGERPEPPLLLTADLQSALKKQPGRADFQRGLLHSQEGRNLVCSTGRQGSGILSSMAKANCYIALEQERNSANTGESVRVIPFDKFLL